MEGITIIRQGESLPFEFDRGGQDTDGWTCLIEVRQYPGDAATISRAIPLDTDKQWSGFLTQTETALLSIGLYYLTAKLTHAVDDEEEQLPKRFHVSEAWA